MESGCDFRKCGEISASLSEGKQTFYLNCDFCESKYLELNNFIQHIYDDHLAQLPSRLFKQERTSLHSFDPFDYDLGGAVEDNPEDDLNVLDSSKESNDTHLSNNFETVLLDPRDVDIKEEHPLNVSDEEYKLSDQSEINNSDQDVTSDDNETASDSEIFQKKKNSRRKSQNNSNEDANDFDGTKKAVAARFKKCQKYPKPRARDIKITDAIINDSQCIILAEIYKKHACLWDEKDISYRFNNKRDEAMASAREEFNKKTELNLTEYDFEREVVRIRKICSYEKKQKIICEQNKTEHKPSCTYYDYIKFLDADVSPFVCSICGDQQRVLGRLKVHEAKHDGSPPFKCHICGRGFHMGINLTRHLRRHERDRRFQCELCEKAFVTQAEVILHMRRHTGEKPYVCYICGLKFVSSSALIDHSMRSHEKDRRFKCEICSKAFYSQSTLREHRKTHKKIRDYVCEICNKAFKSQKHLTQHNHIHDTVKRYICKICGKRFAQSAGLCGHMKSHGIISTTNSTDIN